VDSKRIVGSGAGYGRLANGIETSRGVLGGRGVSSDVADVSSDFADGASTERDGMVSGRAGPAFGLG
jgi:hypothetical protein